MGKAHQYVHLVQAGGKGLEGQPFSAGAVAAHLPCPAQGTSDARYDLGIGFLKNITGLAQL